MVKSLKFIVTTPVFEGLEGCVRERKRYQQNIKMIIKPIPKSMKNQCKIYTRKSDATNIEKHRKWSRKGNPKS